MEKIITKKGEHIVKTYIQATSDVVIEMGDGSAIDLFLMTENATAEQLLAVKAGRDCRISITTLDLGGDTFCRNTNIDLSDKGTQCNLNGVFITSHNERCTNKVEMRHSAGDCLSQQMFRGVAAGNSQAVFRGHIYVAKNAQQTVALQENHNILLSDAARIETRPELEIYADNVKCNHGATVGREDTQAMFYLAQRGIPPHEARALLIEGFCKSALKLDLFESRIQEFASERLTEKLLSL